MNDEIAYEWSNIAGDFIYVPLNDNGNVEIEPEAFEDLLRLAGFRPTE